jgi:hypothetical protein
MSSPQLVLTTELAFEKLAQTRSTKHRSSRPNSGPNTTQGYAKQKGTTKVMPFSDENE